MATSTLRRLLLPAVALAAAGIGSAAPASPTILRIEPPGGPRDGEITIRIHGQQLGEPEELLFEDGLIEVRSLKAIDGRQLEATLAIPADCPPGPHRLRVRTTRGLSTLRTFRVGLLPQQTEKELAGGKEAARNDTPASAERVDLPGPGGLTIHGVVQAEDVDCFWLHAAAGERIAAAVAAVRLDHTPFDPFLEIIDADGFVIAASDDHPLLEQDAMAAVTVENDGDYVVRIRETAYRGSDDCQYLLHLGRFPVAHLAVPPGGRPGEAIDVEWLGDPAGPFSGRLTLPESFRRNDAAIAGLFRARPLRDGVAAAEGVPLRITKLPVATESEPNGDAKKAAAHPLPTAIWGRLAEPDDVDWIRLEGAKGSKWRITSWGRRLGSPIDLVLNAHRDDAKRQRITGNDDAAGPDAAITVTVPEEGSFLLRIHDHQRRGGPEFVWWIEAEPIEPSLDLSVPPARTKTQEGLVAEVPRGNRVAMVFNASREDFRGTAAVEAADLPAGVTASFSPLTPKAAATLAVFEATADAPLAAALTRLTVTNAEPPGARLGGLVQATELVHGQPNREPWRTSTSSRLPIAVVEEAPVTIHLKTPPVPLVRSGRATLEVRIDRHADFTGKIRLDLPFKPPGVGATAGVNVPAGASQAEYELSCSADAPLASWQLAVAATITPEGEAAKRWRPMRIATPAVPLTVAEPMLTLAVAKAAAEQGSTTAMRATLAEPATLEAAAEARLLGLPAKTEASPVRIEPGATEVAFEVAVADDAPPGRHGNVICEVRVPRGEHVVVHRMQATEFRIDKPLQTPAKKQAAKKQAATPARKTDTLSRREKLRQRARALAEAEETE